eukprot:jgi/Chlat1/3514/Chrsp23S03706
MMASSSGSGWRVQLGGREDVGVLWEGGSGGEAELLVVSEVVSEAAEAPVIKNTDRVGVEETVKACRGEEITTSRVKNELPKHWSDTFHMEDDYIPSSGNQSGTSFSAALVNCVNILLGVGLLSIPFALKVGGWGALGVLALLGIVTNYTGKLLGYCQDKVCLAGSQKGTTGSKRFVRGLESYEDIGEAAFGDIGRKFITFILYTELVGTCGLFFILEGDNITRLIGGDPRTVMYLSAFAFIPTTWLPDLRALAGLGIFGALASVSLLGVVLYSWYSLGFVAADNTALFHPSTLPLTFGLLAFVYAGHAVFPSIKSSMQQPEQYDTVLNYTYLLVGGVCALLGVVGYAMYGSSVLEEVTLNLPAGPLATFATCLIVVNPFTKFALTLEPVERGVENALQLNENPDKFQTFGFLVPPKKIAVRTALGLSALLLATSVPFFGIVMSLIGACLTLCVSVIFPSMCYLAIFGDQVSTREKIVNYLVVIIGIMCAVSGTYTGCVEVLTK